MKQPFSKYSDAEQALYTLGFNMAYNLDAEDLKKDKLLQALEKEYAKGKSMHPFSEGMFDGLDTNKLLKGFLFERIEAVKGDRDQELELDL